MQGIIPPNTLNVNWKLLQFYSFYFVHTVQSRSPGSLQRSKRVVKRPELLFDLILNLRQRRHDIAVILRERLTHHAIAKFLAEYRVALVKDTILKRYIEHL